LAGEVLVEGLGKAVGAIATAAAPTPVTSAAAIAAPASLAACSTAVGRKGRRPAETSARGADPSSATSSFSALAAYPSCGTWSPLSCSAHREGTVFYDAVGAVIPQEERKSSSASTAAFSAGAAFTSFSATAPTPTRTVGVPIVNGEARYIVGNPSQRSTASAPASPTSMFPGLTVLTVAW